MAAELSQPLLESRRPQGPCPSHPPVYFAVHLQLRAAHSLLPLSSYGHLLQPCNLGTTHPTSNQSITLHSSCLQWPHYPGHCSRHKCLIQDTHTQHTPETKWTVACVPERLCWLYAQYHSPTSSPLMMMTCQAHRHLATGLPSPSSCRLAWIMKPWSLWAGWGGPSLVK
jgi:hypothetical protein